MTDKGHILVVDDDLEIRELLAHFLREHGFQVSLAEDGEALFRELGACDPDLIVLRSRPDSPRPDAAR
jgi:two-component system OmpR family response regulator